MSPSPAVALIVVLLPACNRPVDEGLGDLGEGGIAPPATTDLDTGAQEASAGPTDVPRDVGTDEDASTGEDAPASMCGNGTIEGDEDCDGDELALQTCMTWGFLAGALACN